MCHYNIGINQDQSQYERREFIDDRAKSQGEMSLPTPYIGHLTSEDYEHTYEPAGEDHPSSARSTLSLLTADLTDAPEDSFILLDALEQDANLLRGIEPALCIEIGSALALPGARCDVQNLINAL